MHIHETASCLLWKAPNPMTTLKDILTQRPVAATIRLTVPAGGARPAPPVGPALGQYRLNLMAFCKDFNV
ncbi:hypothetical protein K1719_014752 [Acacia pycnantha]|nr:hypothetical protein K1719_014752 [Acacia pycnantha]